MGLDAIVYCDCFERGTLKTPPRAEWQVYVDDDGSRATAATDLEVQMAFDRWSYSQACQHERGVMLHHRIGNISLVAGLRQVIGQQPDKFPLILEKVLYSGSHTGDFLTFQEVEAIAAEVAMLSEVHPDDEQEEQFLRGFESQLSALVACARRLKKPLAF